MLKSLPSLLVIPITDFKATKTSLTFHQGVNTLQTEIMLPKYQVLVVSTFRGCAKLSC